MSYTDQYLNFALLLSILLSSCTSTPQPTKDRAVSPALESTAPQTTFYLDTSALSYGTFDTDATSLIVDVSNTVPREFSAFADISIENGTVIKTYKVNPGESTIIHSMPPGKKQVRITSGGQIRFNSEIAGVFINKITFNGSAMSVKQEGKQILVYGDSITVGGNVDNLSAEAWPVLLRKHFPVIVEAYGYGTLYDDTATAEARSKFVSKISAWAPDYIWLAIGTNDYGFEKWSAWEFGEAYAATLDAIRLSNPRVLVFAQSPILRADESPNSFGDNLGKYRQQIASACSSRPDWCVFVDGTDPAFPQPGELDKDGIHLTTKSSMEYAEAVLNILGKQ